MALIRPLASRSCLALSSLGLALALGPCPSSADEAIPGVSATAVRPRLPMLIGNERSPLLRVVVEVGNKPGERWARNDVRLDSLSFALDGTDDLTDLESLTLLASDAEDDFRQRRWPNPANVRHGREGTRTTALGGALAPAARLTFPVDCPLRAGRNVFWLSGRLRDSADLIHRLAATCTEVVTSAGRIVPSDGSHGFRQRIGVALRKAGDDGVDTYAIPALTTTPKGTLLCVYDMRWRAPGHDLQDHITTGLSRSPDGGKTWEPMRTIMSMGTYGGLPPEQNGCSDPGIIVDGKTGEIFCFAIWMHGKPGHHQWFDDGSEPGYEIGKSAQFLMVRSRDDGRTWSQPENLTRSVKRAEWWLLAPAPTQGMQLADGTLVMPVQGRDESGRDFSTVMTSADHGIHWITGSPAPFKDCSECQAVELGDGSIMLNARSERVGDTHRAVFVTADLGRTWRTHATSRHALIEPPTGCNGSIFRMDYRTAGGARHILLFSNPHSETDRVDQTVQVSFDDGLTWPRDHHLLLDEGRGWAYPCLTRIDAERVGIVYAGSQADVVFQALPLRDLLEP